MANFNATPVEAGL